MRILLLLSFLVSLASAAAAVVFDKSHLVIETQDGARHDFEVELAETQEQRAQGLMFRQSLAPNAGMLFLYDEPQMPRMWMRNTYIPLDMLFLDESGLVLATADNAVPRSPAIISPGVTAMAVLELPGDAIERLGLKAGDRVLHPRLGYQP